MLMSANIWGLVNWIVVLNKKHACTHTHTHFINKMSWKQMEFYTYTHTSLIKCLHLQGILTVIFMRACVCVCVDTLDSFSVDAF